jgi:riboflavin kinase/FMN adenylyltransferase
VCGSSSRAKLRTLHNSDIKRQVALQLIRGLHNLREHHRGCVLTIGKFDGVHLGHQAVLRNLVEKAKELGLPSTVMIFEPQPAEVFAPERAPARLSRFRDKYVQFKALGIERLVCVRFNQAFAAMSPESFIQKLLVQQLGVKFLVVGDDFRFGHQRKGNFELLVAAGAKAGFDVVSTQSFKLANCRISSTEIREALSNSNLSLVKEMLGRDFTIAGRVNHGDKKGRTIGFPTANVLLKRCKSPVSGVFAVEVKIASEYFKGVANIGNRPTVSGTRSQLEVHLFDVKKDLYGAYIEVAIKQKLRDEIKFENFEALRQQIQRDAKAARDIFNI